MNRNLKFCLALSAVAVALGGLRIARETRSKGSADFASSAEPWILQPNDVGPDIPPRGASLFDRLFLKEESGKVVHDVPYPFSKLVASLETMVGRRIDPLQPAGPKGVLIPLGRSLQRNAAINDDTNISDLNAYFRFPRVVIGIDEEAASKRGSVGHLLKDRLFVGFHERAEVLEVISYNEDAGRFEYQIVRDYTGPGKAKVFYARRSLCLSCHQNQSPLFAEQPWSETNAHDEIKRRLLANLGASLDKDGRYHGVPTQVGITTPYAFNNSTDRANFFMPTQRIWDKLCASDSCRIGVLLAGWQRALAKPQTIKSEVPQGFVKELESAFARQFPSGMWIPNPVIPNRNPLESSQGGVSDVGDLLRGGRSAKELQNLLRRSLVPAKFEPLQPRPALEVWRGLGWDTQLDRFLSGVSDQFSAADYRQLDDLIAAYANESRAQPTTCQWEVLSGSLKSGSFELDVSCASAGADLSFYVQLASGVLKSGQLGALSLKGEQCALASRVQPAPGRPCMTIEEKPVFVAWSPSSGQITIELRDRDGLRLRSARGNSFLPLKTVLPHAGTSLSTTQPWGLSQDWDTFLDWFARDFAVKNASVLQSKVIARRAIMSRLLAVSGRLNEDPTASEKQVLALVKQVENSTIGLPPELSQTPLKHFVSSCAVCHRNAEGVPANFLGASQLGLSAQDLCERISVCAPRILYRLKMWSCSAEDRKTKKNQMPPPHAFFGFLDDSEEEWKTKYHAALVGIAKELVSVNELQAYLSSKGMSPAAASSAVSDLMNSSCPTLSGVDFQRYFPTCEFSSVPDSQRCAGLFRRETTKK